MRLWLFKSYCNMTDLVWEFLFYFVKPFSLSNNKGILLSLVSATSDAKFMIRLSLAGLVCLDIFKIKKTPLQIYFVYIVNSGDYMIGKGNEVHVYSICGRLSFEAFRYLSLWKYTITIQCWVLHSEYISQLRNHTRHGACISHLSTYCAYIQRMTE